MFSQSSMIEKGQGLLSSYGPSILSAVVILFLGYLIAKIIRKVIEGMLGKMQWDKGLTGFLGNLSYMAVMMFVIITALGKLGVPTGSFVAVVGAAGLAIGLALQGSLSNFASGVFILAFRPFKVGDYVESAGIAGVVEEIQIFSTILKSPDNKRLIVPNASVMGGNIVNYSSESTRRVDMTFGIGYGDSIDEAREVLRSVLDSNSKILKDPEPQIVVGELGDNSVNFYVRPWANSADYWAVLFETQEAVKKAFDAKGISIPYPQRDVHLYNSSEG